MMPTEPRGGFAIVISFIVAFVLVAVPLPTWMEGWRPAWVTLVLVYWCLAAPGRVNVGVGWFVGLLLDVLTGSLLGQRALALSVVAFVSNRAHQQLRVLPIWQQGLGVFALVLVCQLLMFWVDGAQGQSPPVWAYGSSPLTSAFLWPWVFVTLEDVRQRYQIA